MQVFINSVLIGFINRLTSYDIYIEMQFSRIMAALITPKCRFSIRTVSVLSAGEMNRGFQESFSYLNDTVAEDKHVNALQKSNEDLSLVVPYFPQTFNLAAYVNISETLQNLVHLKVDLSKIEKKPYIVEKILKLDFDRDIKNHIFFLNNYIEPDAVGRFLSKNPLFLCESLENLKVRVNYLESKRFSVSQIQRIILKNPFWLMLSTTRIDRRLGYFQQNFSLQGDEVRYLATKQPKIITYNLHHIQTNTFVIKEEMGFEDHQTKQLILMKPQLWIMNQRSLLERFNYFHNVIKVTHQTLLQYPEVLLCRKFKIKQRHLFLEKLGRAQFDPKKENFIPIKALVEETDIEFCKKYAKCSVTDFNLFLKTS